MALLILLALICVIGSIFLQHAKFGQMPSGQRLARIQKSVHYKDGRFQNLSVTPDLTEGANYFSVLNEFIFGKSKRSKPSQRIPSQHTDLHALDPDEELLVWFGHSSYFMQLDGKKILVDPVLSGAASPIKATTRSFPGTDAYTPDDIPEIDWLFLTHDHWDHLDYETIVKLRPKIKTVLCGLGVAAHLERWGFAAENIIERDWNETVDLGAGFVVHTTPARHFSGRSFKRNQSLWLSFVLQAPSKKIYIGGDSGYDSHFRAIGNLFGPFDLVILECGQYDKSWKYIHLLPEEVLQAAKDLNAKALLPVHWGKFALGNHAWDEPIVRITAACAAENFPLVTPMIGEKVNLNAPRTFESWWQTIS